MRSVKKTWQTSMAVTAFTLALLVPPGSTAQDQGGSGQPSATELSQKIQVLESELNDLRTQVAALREGNTAVTSSKEQPAVAPAQANLVTPAGTSTPAEAQRTPLAGLLGSTTFSGFVDVYYGANFNHPTSRSSTLRSFDVAANQFSLNLAELVVDKTPDASNSRTGYHIALGFGQAMNAVNGTDPAGLGFAQPLKEAYFSYLAPVGKGLQLDVGKFVTPHGAEVIETKDNWNYSRGLLFSYAIPYYHFGLRAKYKFSDKYTLSGFAVNGWNSVMDNNSGRTYGAGFAWTPVKVLTVSQNYMFGPEQADTNAHWRQLSDTVITITATPKLSFIANYDYGRGDRIEGLSHPVSWTGFAGYVRYAIDSRYAVATRYEYYDDHDGFTTATAQHLNGITGTFERLIAGHLLTRLEFRRDMSNRNVFTRGDSPVESQSTFTAGLVYMFDSREAK